MKKLLKATIDCRETINTVKKIREATVNTEKLFEFRCTKCNAPRYRANKVIRDVESTHVYPTPHKGKEICGEFRLRRVWSNPKEA